MRTHHTSDVMETVKQRVALVFSAGGLFGAYQAGVWAALSDSGWRPDLVIGASIGSLNGWAVAGGCPAEELADRWRAAGDSMVPRWQLPRSILDGVVDSTPVRQHISTLYRDFQPQMDYGLVMTELPRPRPHLVTTPEIGEDHLVASCAIPGVYRQPRLDGRIFSDGGLLCPLPLWAAAEMGATHIVAVNALTEWPWYFHAVTRSCGRAVVNRLAAPGLPSVIVQPSESLGSRRDTVVWSQRNVERWLEQGEADGRRALPELYNLLDGVSAY